MVFILLLALSSCLQRPGGERVSVEPAVSEETVADAVSEETGAGIDEEMTSIASTFEKPSVQDIQRALKNANLYEGKIDGILGPKTKNAIEVFQSQNNLTPDGKVGPKTWQKLKEFLAKKAE